MIRLERRRSLRNCSITSGWTETAVERDACEIRECGERGHWGLRFEWSWGLASGFDDGGFDCGSRMVVLVVARWCCRESDSGG